VPGCSDCALRPGVRSLERIILRFVGISPVRDSLIGMVEGRPAARERWLDRMRALGRDGA
jgi:hypothetical protein